MKHTLIDLSGQRFGRLTVIQQAPTKKRITRWYVQCECGRELITVSESLRKGGATHCGCQTPDRISKLGRNTRNTHGDSRSTGRHYLYTLWTSIKTRCFNTTRPCYPDYGGRGISMHPEWVKSYEAFKQWMLTNLGERPSGYAIDRINNDGDYTPGNLRWADRHQQNRNRRKAS